MSNIALQATQLGKMYRIGGAQQQRQTFREVITQSVTAPFRRAHDLLRGQAYGAAGLHEEIWALQDISFEIKHGEVVGIIGRNGAGKSTLLKILSRITEPSAGRVDVYGRVGSLLEVGTGFHAELTGRENIYLNGAILGMSRNMIKRKFDEIVEFSGVEKFIDTPVKHYSSGMGLRLGFAVAAHLEPDILVVDEVLAVGDAEFQKRCLGKMSEVAGEGRTVLFVSHNMAMIKALCSRAILLQSGQLTSDGSPDNIIRSYLSHVEFIAEDGIVVDDELYEHDERFALGQVAIFNTSNELVDYVQVHSGLRVQIDYSIPDGKTITGIRYVELSFHDEFGVPLFACSSKVAHNMELTLKPQGQLNCVIPKLPLLPGEYIVSFEVKLERGVKVEFNHLFRLKVVEADVYGTGLLPGRKKGTFVVEYSWQTD